MNIHHLSFLTAMASLIGTGTAYAAPPPSVQLTGKVFADVVTPASVMPLRALRFGQFLQPTSAGTITVAIDSTVTATGGMIAAVTTPQLAPGRGAGGFTLKGPANRQFDLTLPASATISNGPASMTVNNFTANVNGGGKAKFDATGTYILNVGARLNVSSGQAIGAYTGTYQITVFFN